MRITLMVCLLVLHVYSHAQQADTTKLLDEVVISVNRWEENLREVPNRVTKIDASLIQFQNPQTAADLLSISNQVFVQKSQLGGGSPMIRGFATNRVLLVVDGVRFNNAIFRSGNVQNVISLDPNIIETSEVIFGPGSVVYGSDAIGGVMDFHTRPARLSSDEKLHFAGNALMRYSSANKENTGHLDVNFGLKKWAFLTSVTYSTFDDLKQGSNGPDEYLRPDYMVRENDTDVVKTNSDPRAQVPTGYNQLNLMQKIRFKPNANWDLNYSFHQSKTSRYDRYDRLILKNNQNNFVSAEWYYGPQEWLMHSFQANYISPTVLFDAARLTVAYQDYSESRHNRNRNNANRNNRFENVKAWSANLDMDKKMSEQVQLFYGAEFVTNKVYSTAYRFNINTEAESPLSTRYPDDSDWRSMAAYLSMKIKLGESWLATVSNRFNYVYTYAMFDNAFFDFPVDEATLRNKQVNNSLGLIYSPTDRWKVFANFSTGFRAPNIDDIGKVFDSQPGNVVVPNPNLKPETAYNFEMGAAIAASKTFSFDVGAYYTTIDNAIARAPFTFNGQDSIDFDGTLSRVLALQNVNELYVYGFQAGIDWKILASLRLTSTVNIQKGKEKDFDSGLNSPPTHVAPTFGATHVVYTYKKLRANLYATYNGQIAFKDLSFSERADTHLYAKDKDGNPYSPSWWTLNFKASYNVMKYFSVDAGIENLFDRRYRPYSSGISAPGRNFIVSLRGRI
ncbi:MAG: TonB-dependent receptor [Cyclobacteriaceae bacterium]|nr:TonB-dependent receptor [Cyclobacteriaceae bacterium]UYN86904.1 MAG: TonB-dependent receptor [Cyclobacteriaceae bacterium]